MSKQIVFNREECTGCMACIFSCSVVKSGMFSYEAAHLRLTRDEGHALSDMQMCGNCTEQACLNICPAGAIRRDAKTAIPILDNDSCLGCLLCVDACPFGLIRVGPNNTVHKCDLCNGEPACVKACIPQALTFTEA